MTKKLYGEDYNSLFVTHYLSLILLRIRSIAISVSEGELLIKNHRMKSKKHCVKSVRIRSFSSPYFPAFGLNTES